MTHDCPQDVRGICNEVDSEGWGAAYNGAPEWSEKGMVWFVTNGEYASQVWFCPLCGAELPTP